MTENLTAAIASLQRRILRDPPLPAHMVERHERALDALIAAP